MKCPVTMPIIAAFAAALLVPGVLARDRVEEIAARGTTVDGVFAASGGISPSAVFADKAAVHATVVYDKDNVLFSVKGPNKADKARTVEIFYDGKKAPAGGLDKIDMNLKSFVTAAVAE